MPSRTFKYFALGLAAVLAPAVAAAADIPYPTKAPKYIPTYAPTWAGFYIGANVGYSWGPWSSTGFLPGATVAAPVGGTATPNVNGWIGGGQIGYNWQSGNFVYGLEADFQLSEERDRLNWTRPAAGLVAVIPALAVFHEWRMMWFGTARARAGYTFNNWLLYAHGGAAYGNMKSTLDAGPAPSISLSESHSKLGWAAGFGAEWMFAQAWSAKLEYMYMHLGSVHFFQGTTTPVTSSIREHILRVGINYRFQPLSVRF